MPDTSSQPNWDALRIQLQDAGNTNAQQYLTLLEAHGQHDPMFASFWTAGGVEQAMKCGDDAAAARWLRRSLDLGWFQADLVPGYQAVLDAQPDAFRAQRPAPEPTASATAPGLLTWAHTRWAHAGATPAGNSDALELLERAAQGERFRCVEYVVILTAALNAHGLPAQTLGLTVADFHAGVGAGHVVTAAWLDDHGAWVVLDGQHGALWHDGDLRALGVRELQRRFAVGEARPQFTQPDGTPVKAPGGWWLYFAHANPGVKGRGPGIGGQGGHEGSVKAFLSGRGGTLLEWPDLPLTFLASSRQES